MSAAIHHPVSSSIELGQLSLGCEQGGRYISFRGQRKKPPDEAATGGRGGNRQHSGQSTPPCPQFMSGNLGQTRSENHDTYPRKSETGLHLAQCTRVVLYVRRFCRLEGFGRSEEESRRPPVGTP